MICLVDVDAMSTAHVNACHDVVPLLLLYAAVLTLM